MLEAPLDYSTDNPLLDISKPIYHPIVTPPDANIPNQETESATSDPVPDKGTLTPVPEEWEQPPCNW